MSERHNIATIANDFLKAGLLLGVIARVTCAIMNNSTCKVIEIALGFASYYFNYVTRAINPELITEYHRMSRVCRLAYTRVPQARA